MTFNEDGKQPQLQAEMSPLSPNRRSLLRNAGLGAALAGAFAAGMPRHAKAAAPEAVTDVDILNFALNLEYLEAEYYQHAVFGIGLPESLTSGTGRRGAATGGRKVKFKTKMIQEIAEEIATDELNHVIFLKNQLGASAVAQPVIDISTSFAALGVAAGLGFTFDPYQDEVSFLLGGYVFEDVGVTAYNGAAPLLTNKTFLGYAASILAVEAYHASELRLLLLQHQMGQAANQIAATRAAVSGTGPGTAFPADDQGPRIDMVDNIVPADTNSLAFARTTDQVLSVVYLGGTTSGGFYPDGVNGTISSVS